jgi:DNA mismatch endonuclease (patch repair protein)
MADLISKERRSWNMSRIRSTDTAPERIVRSALHRLGYRFRLHRKDLPGRPDVVLPRFKLAIFVHGCFWHRHPGCRFAYAPKSNRAFWNKKFRENMRRDREKLRALRAGGWRVVVIWECCAERVEKLNRILQHVVLACERQQVYRMRQRGERRGHNGARKSPRVAMRRAE